MHTMKTPTALITGCTGQDGSYLAEFLLSKGYIVHGIKRRASSFNTARVDHLYQDPHTHQDTPFFMHYGDMTDATNLIRLVQNIQPDEIYNLAAQSHVHVSFETPEYTANADALGTLRLLEAMRILKLTDKTRFYQASTSELYGNTPPPQSETSPFAPASPYAAAKLYAYWITVNYRQAYGIFAANGILFNHESPRRGETFVSRKITRAVARIYLGQQETLYLGNLDARRDWGHTQDYVDGMWRILQHNQPDDFVLATGQDYSVRDFAVAAFAEIGVAIRWQGTGKDEVGIDNTTNTVRIKVDPRYFRPNEVDFLKGDANKAKQLLNWQATISFNALVREMVQADIAAAKQQNTK